jgi:hypothetical protein
MRYDDFLKYFGTLNICNMATHISITKTGEVIGYIREDFNGEWVEGVSAGGSLGTDNFHLNPQYTLTIDDSEFMNETGDCTVLIELLQKNRRRLMGGSNFLYPGIVIYELKDNQRAPLPKEHFSSSYPKYYTTSFVNTRAITVRIKLKPGKYVIIPSTYRPVGAEFVLRIYVEQGQPRNSNKTEKKNEEVRLTFQMFRI